MHKYLLTFTLGLLAACTPNPSPNGSFTLSASPTSPTLTQGDNVIITVNVSTSGGFSGNVNLSLEQADGSALPRGITPSFSPASLSAGSSTLSVSAEGSLAAQTYALRVKGVAGSLTQTTPLDLRVVVPPPARGGSLSLREWPSGQNGRLDLEGLGLTGTVVLGSATITAGTVSYSLESSSNSDPLSLTPPDGCTSTVTASAPDAKVDAVAQISAYLGSATTPSGYVQIGNRVTAEAAVGDQEALLYYADKAVQVMGTETCPDLTTIFNLSLSTGWNYLISRVTAAAQGKAIAVELTSSPTLPPNLKWYYRTLGVSSLGHLTKKLPLMR